MIYADDARNLSSEAHKRSADERAAALKERQRAVVNKALESIEALIRGVSATGGDSVVYDVHSTEEDVKDQIADELMGAGFKAKVGRAPEHNWFIDVSW